jgi:glycine cleavage system aminomethyltransferase T
MKRSALHRWHEKAGATLIEEEGWYVPLRYSSAENEARAVRGSVGICDLSHIHEPLSPYARFLIAGPDARALLSKLTSINLDLTTTAPTPLRSWLGNARARAVAGAVAHVRSLVTRHELGFLVMVPRDYAESVWEAILHAGEEFHITPFGLEAHRRLEA